MSGLGQIALPFDGDVPVPQGRSNTTAFGDNMVLPVHRWFRYSAGFSAEWAQKVIRDVGASRVVDPFAGSGTTLLAAESENAESIGVDAHPFVAKVARAKLAWRANPDEVLDLAARVTASARKLDEVQTPTSALVEKCFDPDSLDRLTRLRDALIAESAPDDVRSVVWLALVSILRVCSPVGTAQWQYVLPNKTKSRVAEPYSAFTARARIFAGDMRSRQRDASGPAASFRQEDARDLASLPANWADLVVTSPPYANNYDYADVARLEMSFLGEVKSWGDLKPIRDLLMKSCSQQMVRYDPNEAFESDLLKVIRPDLLDVYAALSEIRMSKGGKKAYHYMILAYFLDAAKVMNSLRRVCRPGSKMCWVVGDSAPYGIYVPVEEWLGMLALDAGFKEYSFESVRGRNEKWKNRKHRVPLKEGRLWIEG
jgi:DNA modification methylase